MMYLFRFLVRVTLGMIGLLVALSLSGETVRLQLKWKHQFQFAGYYAAIEKGYYAERGLEVLLIEPEDNEEPMNAVLAGKADYGVSTSDIILMRASGKPVVALASIFQHSPLVLLARKDAGISSLQDLSGKSVMIEPHSADLHAMLQKVELAEGAIRLQPFTFTVDALIAGKLDAMSAYLTDEPFSLDAAQVPTVTLAPRNHGIDFYGDGLFTTESELREHPERVKAFLDASLKGWDYALNHPEEIADLILHRYSQRKTREHLLFEAMRMRELIHPGESPIGFMSEERWKHIAETFRAVDMLEAEIDWDVFLYSTDSPAVDSE